MNVSKGSTLLLPNSAKQIGWPRSSRSYFLSKTCSNCLTIFLAQRKAKLDANKPEPVSEKPVEVVDEGPKKYKIAVNKKGDKTTYPKKGDKV